MVDKVRFGTSGSLCSLWSPLLGLGGKIYHPPLGMLRPSGSAKFMSLFRILVVTWSMVIPLQYHRTAMGAELTYKWA